MLLADLAPLREDPPGPPRLDAELSLGTGTGEVLAWSAVPTATAPPNRRRPTPPVCPILGRTPGRVMIRAAYLPGEGLRPVPSARSGSSPIWSRTPTRPSRRSSTT
ncbi:hypothetical protein LV779_25700 [Streptomyces thinghirensis]|nr:hypothetical protein [Streptomyces thinghirensis]